MFDTTTIIGFVGALLILVAFTLNQLGRWQTTDVRYDVVNAVGALLLIGYAYLLESYPFILLNTVWFLVAIRDLVLKGK
jgi:hypothetical protein